MAEFARVCAYDRAGLGQSSPAPAGQTALDIVDRLDGLLSAIGERPPFVMVGHSYGGAIVMLYAVRHPTSVIGDSCAEAGLAGMGCYCEWPRAATGQITSTRSFRVP